jgi:PKD repeat protein
MFQNTIRKSGWILVIHLLFFVYSVNGQAAFSADKRSGCAPLQVNFTNLTPGNNSYTWNLGNGNQPVTTNATANYSVPGTYIVTLTATSVSGTISVVTDTITVHPKPTAAFSVSQLSGCVGATVFQFANSSSGATAYIWDFGDGTSSSDVDPSHTYSQPGTYCVKLIAESGAGCRDIRIQTNCITVHALPSASIGMSMGGSCDSNTVFQFTGSGSGISAWSWNFGDGSTANTQQATHIYGSTGSFPVSLTVTSTNGCTDTFFANAPVTIGPALSPVFSAADSSGCAPFTTQFSCTMPGTTTWSWDFGDGNTSTLANPQHTYATAGIYSVSLQVSTTPGCSGTSIANQLITVHSIPTVSVTANQDSGCAPFSVQFQSNSTGSTQFNWDFGNGNSSTLNNPTHTYTQSGTFTPTLTVTSGAGCTASTSIQPAIRVFSPKAFFSGSPLIGCPGMTVNFQHTAASTFIVQYDWNFGDGNTGSGRNVSHTYTQAGVYSVSLIVTNSFGCKDTVIKNNYVTVLNPQLTIQNPDTLYVCEDLPAVFSDPGNANISWSWDFGNGSTSTNQTDVTFYTQPGFYTVTLQTVMPGGCVQTFSPFAIVRVIPYDPQPIQFSHDNPCKPYTVSFNNATPDVNGYSWDFGDGNSSTLANPTHSYYYPGTYVVTLSVLVGDGCVGSISTTITVGHQNPIRVSDNDICTGVRTNISLANPLEFSSATWFFGDGTSGTGASVFHNYTDTGAFAITLITTDLNGCIDTFTYAPINVHNPIPLFGTVRDACINSAVQFNNFSTGADNYEWEFGDGGTANSVNPIHTYTQAGTYSITLHATSGTCTSSRTWNGYIHIHAPESRFSLIGAGPCLPVTVSFNDQSTGAAFWNWEFGDGNSSTLNLPTHVYTTPPSDSIRLTITDAYGCSDAMAIAPFPVYQAQANVDDPTGCIPHAVQFTDQSQQGIAWQWNFGDGTYSTSQNPQHTYSANGYYTVTLIVEFPGNCFDTVVYTDMIHVNTPVAAFHAPNAAGCSPTQVSFINTSSQADQFSWNFGDGNTSTLNNAQNIYYIPGTYTITLIASNNYGCGDTLIRPQYVSIPGTYTRFGISSTSICVGEPVFFSDSSINASVHSWDFGDGPVSSQVQPSHTYAQAGQYTITLITWDSTGCSSAYTYPQPITVHPKPDALATINDSAFCTYEPVAFVNESQGGFAYNWQFGDGTSSNMFSPDHLYTNSGVYTPVLEVITDMGCKDTFVFSSPVEILMTPNAGFTVPAQKLCPGSVLQMNNTSSALDSPVFLWNFGFTTSTQIHPTITVVPGTHDITLFVSNANGCKDTLFVASAVEVYDTLPPNADPIATATVQDDEHVEVIWMNSSASDLKTYRLYRLDATINQWVLIHEDTSATHASVNQTSRFTDSGLNTLEKSYSYKLQTIDECGYALPLDSLIAYTTMNVTTAVNGTIVTVSWTPYEGCDFNEYRIYRKENAFSQSLAIATVPRNQLSFLDTTIRCPYPYEYRIEALALCGRAYTSFSDTSTALPENTLAEQVAEIKRTTVVDNSNVLTEWLEPMLAPERVIEYQILRSVDGGTYTYLATVPAGVHSFLDEDTDVQQKQYNYLILPVNDCYLTGMQSNEGSSIHVKGTWKDYKTTLNWNPYMRWDAGVNHYRIEREESPGNWIFIGDTNPGTTVIEINE